MQTNKLCLTCVYKKIFCDPIRGSKGKETMSYIQLSEDSALIVVVGIDSDHEIAGSGSVSIDTPLVSVDTMQISERIKAKKFESAASLSLTPYINKNATWNYGASYYQTPTVVTQGDKLEAMLNHILEVQQ